MKELLLVGTGGFVGASARYLFAGWATRFFHEPIFPVGTLAVNLLGCFVIGLLAGAIERLHLFGFEGRLLVFTGILGGFTTFSAFGFETLFLMTRKEYGWAVLNLVGSPLGGVALTWVGLKLSQSLF